MSKFDRTHLAGNYVPEGYGCQGFVILGYIDGEQPHSKPRKPGGS